MAIPYRPLGTVKEMLEQLGHEITYVYEDVVFIQHNHFLLQFGATGECLSFYVNAEETDADAQGWFTGLLAQAVARGFLLIDSGSYSILQGKGENVSLEFFGK